MKPLPTAIALKLNAIQIQNAVRLDWELQWPAGWNADPEDVQVEIQRSQFPVGPWDRVGHVPGNVTHFVDIAFDQGTLFQRPYYRVICRRLIR